MREHLRETDRRTAGPTDRPTNGALTMPIHAIALGLLTATLVLYLALAFIGCVTDDD